MRGKHERGLVPTGGPREKKNRHAFANAVVALCILTALFVTVSQVYEYHRLNEPMPASVVTALMGMWTGELFIVAVRQIFGSDVTKKDNTENKTGGV